MFTGKSFVPGGQYPGANRRSDHDVTNTVRVGSATDVRDAVQALFQEACPRGSFDAVWMAFHDFEQIYSGHASGYEGCDTVYHDIQHTLDVTLAMARLIAGHERRCAERARLGADRVTLGLITALFHDAGYIRRTDEPRRPNGAEFTIWHVSRSAEFLAAYLPGFGLADRVRVATRLVHFTGYEINIDDIEIDDPRDRLIGHFLGTADLIAQMADRCYLEKCRDRLYAEFVLGGVAQRGGPGACDVLYNSGIDLLKQTPDFVNKSARVRLDRHFHKAYRNIDALYDGHNPYLACIERNLAHLERLIQTDDWSRLRRNPDCITSLKNPLQTVSALVSEYLAGRNAPAAALTLP